MDTQQELNHELHIGIVGAGIAGLSCALSLASLGFKITLIEKHLELSEIGAGIQLSPNATAILDEWGYLEHIQAQGFKPQGIQFLHWKNGKAIANFPLNNDASQSVYLHIHRADLYHCLLAFTKKNKNISLILGEEVIDIKTSSDKCIAISETSNCIPREYSFDYLIGADGIHSHCKTFINTKVETTFTGNVAWRGLISKDKLPFEIDAKANVVMAPDGHMVFYYVRGGDFLNYIAIKEDKSFKQESWTEQGELDEMLDDFKGWHEDFLNILKQSDAQNLYKWALYDRDPLDTWHNGRLILVGDAAHPLLPYLSQGAAMGIEDAYMLAQCFSQQQEHKQHKQQIGEMFYSLRIERCNKVLEASRANRKLYHERNFIKRFVRDSGTRIFSWLYPEFINNKLRWLYQKP